MADTFTPAQESLATMLNAVVPLQSVEHVIGTIGTIRYTFGSMVDAGKAEIVANWLRNDLRAAALDDVYRHGAWLLVTFA